MRPERQHKDVLSLSPESELMKRSVEPPPRTRSPSRTQATAIPEADEWMVGPLNENLNRELLKLSPCLPIRTLAARNVDKENWQSAESPRAFDGHKQHPGFRVNGKVNSKR